MAFHAFTRARAVSVHACVCLLQLIYIYVCVLVGGRTLRWASNGGPNIPAEGEEQLAFHWRALECWKLRFHSEGGGRRALTQSQQEPTALRENIYKYMLYGHRAGRRNAGGLVLSSGEKWRSLHGAIGRIHHNDCECYFETQAKANYYL